jgi:hypothetical protein
MSNTTLLILPVELLHYIFDNIDAITLLQSVRYVCKYLHVTVNAYHRFRLDFSSVSRSDIKVIARLIHPEQVISLAVSDKNTRLNIIRLFMAHFDIRRFTRLRSLTLLHIGSINLDRFLESIVIGSLISLSIECHIFDISRSLAILSSTITESNLKRLDLNNLDSITKHIAWPAECTLKYLSIGNCSYTEYHRILRCSSHLRTFSLRNCVIDKMDNTLSAFAVHACYSQVTSLTMSECQLAVEDLESILSLTPLLIHLKLISSRSSFDSLFDGYYWEQFIQNKLSCLKNFQFFIINHHVKDDDISTLDSLIAPFCAPFWLDEKHWFVTYDFVFKLSQIVVYTTPVCVINSESCVKCRGSSIDSVCRLTRCPPNQMTNNTLDEV